MGIPVWLGAAWAGAQVLAGSLAAPPLAAQAAAMWVPCDPWWACHLKPHLPDGLPVTSWPSLLLTTWAQRGDLRLAHAVLLWGRLQALRATQWQPLLSKNETQQHAMSLPTGA